MDGSRIHGRAKRSTGQGRVTASLPGLFYALCPRTMVPFFEDDEDPKKPRPVHDSKKREGWSEVEESRKDHDRDGHRHVHVRC